MEVVLTIAYCFVFFYIIGKTGFFKLNFLPGWLPGIFFILKCLAGFGLGLIYTKFYTNHSDTDTFKFFSDSKIMFDSLFTKPFDFFRMLTGIDSNATELYPYYIKMDSWLNTNPVLNDNRTIIRLNTFFRIFSLGYYNVHVVFLNFLSFTGLFCMYKAFSSVLEEKKKELFFFTFLMPSVLFWGSGLLKDGILLSALGMFIYSFSLLLRKGNSLKRLLVFVSSFFALLMTKIYVIILIFPGIIAWWISSKMSSRKVIFTFVTTYCISIILAFNLYKFNPDLNTAAYLFYKKKNFIEIGNEHKASMIPMPDYECSGPSIVLNSPKAFINTLARPFVTDIHGNPMIFLSAMENLLILLSIIVVLFFMRTRKLNIHPLVMFSIIFVLLLFCLIGLITPVLGAIVRYRIAALPFLSFLLIFFYDKDKFLQRFTFLNRSNKTLSS